ncbi:glycosyltransferase family 39 protein [Epilithonimonas zeae]|uniref:glycosyltransferase family 39 protein n=1 Tax=Epilithonimonas zeae TaxID=1416779 RepID=UPI0009418045|nr:glycosyltransferase family 39 protein [Epilithonimonas zeae]
MIKKLLTYKNLCLVSGITVILKVIYIIIIQENISGIEDFTIAKNIVKYHQFSEFINLGGTAFKLPIYPYFLSFFIWLLGAKGLVGVAIFQAILSFFLPILIFQILKTFSQDNIGILAGFLFLLSPAYFLYSASIEATNIFILILLIWLLLYFKVWFGNQLEIKWTIIFGAITAILFLTQVIIVPLAVIMMLGLLIFKKLNFQKFSILVFTALLLYSPWVIRNYYVFNQIVLSKTPAWQNIYYGFTPNGQLLDDLKLIPMARDHYIYQMRDEIDELNMEKIYKNEVAKATQWKPHYFIKKALSNAFCLYYVPPKYFSDDSLVLLLGRKIYVVLVNLISLISLAFLYKKSKPLFWFSLLFFANFTFPYVVGHAANMRFKLDFEWYQLILIAFFLVEISDKYYKQKSAF